MKIYELQEKIENLILSSEKMIIGTFKKNIILIPTICYMILSAWLIIVLIEIYGVVDKILMSGAEYDSGRRNHREVRFSYLFQYRIEPAQYSGT